MLPSLLAGSSLLTLASAQASVQGDCTLSDPSLHKLSNVLSDNATISCEGQPGQIYNAGRYWGTQFSKTASVVVFPATAVAVSHTVRAIAGSQYSAQFAFAGGALSMTNASSSYGAVIDLSYLNSSRVIHDFVAPGNDSTPRTVIMSGVGGFSTGGGIGFLGGAYGFATDRLVAVEVVLASGECVMASKTNEHSDLSWALHGGNGQFGIVTKFWQEAASEPSESQLGVIYIGDDSVEQVQKNAVAWFEENKDPFSVVYYSVGFYPPDLTTTDPTAFKARTVLAVVRMQAPKNPNQLDYHTTIAPLIAGVNVTNSAVLNVSYANLTQTADAFFPYGFRRGFYGPQTTRLSIPFLANVTATTTAYINALVVRGKFPATAFWNAQYAFPGLNGNAPASDADTAWPHSTVGHQMLFSSAYLDAENDELTLETTRTLA